MKHTLFFSFLMMHLLGFAQAPSRVQDLQKEWLVFTDSGYHAYEGQQDLQAVHISFDKRKGVGDYLVMRSSRPVSIFLDDTLLSSERKNDTLFIDSLRLQYNRSDFSLTFHASDIGSAGLTTRLVTPKLVEATEMLTPQPSTFFRDFVFIAAFVILMILLVIIRLNPKLAADYFSVTKIFSLRESEDSIVYTRITSSGNFLFYGFSSLTLGFFLLLLFRHLPQKDWIQIDSFRQALLYWLLLSAGVTILFFAKMIVIYLFAALFNLRDVAGMQFFNWVRVLFLSVGGSITILISMVTTRNISTPWFQFFYTALGWLLVLWIILAFFKIASKARIGLFHLFSYLCATEIIPSLIVLKILYY